jgi:DNA-binding transcriptional ArsR family regulator
MYNQLFKLQEAVFKAMAHSRRLEIIHLLRDQELTVTEIYEMLDLPQANVSQHLQVLKSQNIVSANKEGLKVSYKISHPEYLQIADTVRTLLKKNNANYNYTEDLKIKIQDLVPLTHDLVCGMRVSPKTAGFVLEHKKDVYYFCASGCLEKFKNNPTNYLSTKK